MWLPEVSIGRWRVRDDQLLIDRREVGPVLAAARRNATDSELDLRMTGESSQYAISIQAISAPAPPTGFPSSASRLASKQDRAVCQHIHTPGAGSLRWHRHFPASGAAIGRIWHIEDFSTEDQLMGVAGSYPRAGSRDSGLPAPPLRVSLKSLTEDRLEK